MPSFQNLLSDETVRVANGVGGWVAEDNCSIARLWGSSLFPTRLGSDAYGNCLGLLVSSSADATVATEKINCTPGRNYRAAAWVGQGSAGRSYKIGLRFYSHNGTLLNTSEAYYAGVASRWGLVIGGEDAPEGATKADMYVTILSPEGGEVFLIAWPSMLSGADFGSRTFSLIADHIPDYLFDADKAIGWPLERPFTKYLNLITAPLQDIADVVLGWDYVRSVDSPNNTELLSTMGDPWNIPSAALSWLAQLYGVRLEVGEAVGRATWSSIEAGPTSGEEDNIETWEEWETEIVSGGSGADTVWRGVEGYNPSFYDTIEGWRRQIFSGYNGIRAGRAETIKTYVRMLLDSEDEEPFVYVRKHYRTNPFNLLLSVRAVDDPDPSGNMLVDEVGPILPAGMRIWKELGVERSALVYIDAQEFLENCDDQVEPGGSVLGVDVPLRLIEDNMCSGRYVRLASHSTDPDPYLGGGIALARYFAGHALYSGAVEVTSGSLHDIVDDMEIRALVSDVTPPVSGKRFLCGVPDKWEVYIRSDEHIEFWWFDSYDNAHLAVSSEPLDWSILRNPFHISIKLDVDGSEYAINPVSVGASFPRPELLTIFGRSYTVGALPIYLGRCGFGRPRLAESAITQAAAIPSPTIAVSDGTDALICVTSLGLLASVINAWARSVLQGITVSFGRRGGLALLVSVPQPANMSEFLWGLESSTIYPAPLEFSVSVPPIPAFDLPGLHVVYFNWAPFDKSWEQIGDAITMTGATEIDSNTGGIQVLSKEIDPDVLGLSCVLYRIRVFDGITGLGDRAIIDLDFRDEGNPDIHTAVTGASCFECMGGDPDDAEHYPDPISISVSQAEDSGSGVSGLSSSYWVALNHNGDDFFYFGNADAGNGDSLVVSGLADADHDYKVFYADATSAGANPGTSTSITFNATNADVAGKAIRKIEIYAHGTTSPVLACFDADDFFWDDGDEYPAKNHNGTYDPNQTTKADPIDGDATWTLTRLWDTENEYEYSGHVSRSFLRFKKEPSLFDLPVQTTFGYASPFTVALSVRRFWAESGVTNIVDNVLSSGGWRFYYSGDYIYAVVTDGITSIALAWDEVAAGRLGKLNLLALRRDPVARTVELIVNNELVDSAEDTLVGQPT